MGSSLWNLLEMLVLNCEATDAIEISEQSVDMVCSSPASYLFADVDNYNSFQLDVSLFLDDTTCHRDLEPLLER